MEKRDVAMVLRGLRKIGACRTSREHARPILEEAGDLRGALLKERGLYIELATGFYPNLLFRLGFGESNIGNIQHWARSTLGAGELNSRQSRIIEVCRIDMKDVDGKLQEVVDRVERERVQERAWKQVLRRKPKNKATLRRVAGRRAAR